MRDREGVILFISLSLILLVIILAAVMLNIISSNSRLTYHQTSRIAAYYSAKAGMNLALENLRKGVWTQDAVNPRYYCINGNVDSSVTCLATQMDSDIPYNVQITVLPRSQPGISNAAKIVVKTSFPPP